MRVLLVERDAAMVRVLERSLRSHGFEVVSADSVNDAATLAEDQAISIVVCDVSSSTADDWGMLHRLRTARPSLPLLLLVGGEDCLPKPFALEELVGRIRSRTRTAMDPRPTTLIAGKLRLDLLGRCAWYGEQLIELRNREFTLLEYFVRHPNRILSRQVILADVWGYDEDPGTNVVDVYVRYLRRRLSTVAAETSMIVTLRGMGYRFNAPEFPSRP